MATRNVIYLIRRNVIAWSNLVSGRSLVPLLGVIKTPPFLFYHAALMLKHILHVAPRTMQKAKITTGGKGKFLAVAQILRAFLTSWSSERKIPLRGGPIGAML
jgi:hypothetical protein